ncbi:hypothetical protein J437_LFUL012984 [Ladona fulva]|uniref:Uncharacterized protein n=1 Tax=Ladona fulva TaxID=123851 RepID=A0A8K0KE22_LADFU|nr:hypothetical protein J437_LFUL012984 [Ladona fulva]
MEEMPSPIFQANTVDDNHGYHSDRSSPVGSITDGVRGNRTFSQGSSLAGADSLHSSPMTSPHGSSQALHQIPTRNGWQHRDPQGHTMKANSRSHSRDNIHYNHSEDPASNNAREMKPVSEVSTEKLNANSDSCKVPMAMASQLRPQVDQGVSMLRSGPGRGGIRPPGISSGIPRPQSRLQSRIPAPMQRIPVSRLVQKKPTKSDWMDGCY